MRDQPVFAEIRLPVGTDGAYTYAIPAGLAVEEGDCVEVPLGKRTLMGTLWRKHVQVDFDPARIKPIIRRMDVPPLPADLRRLIDFIADYTLIPKGVALALAFRDPDQLAEIRPRMGVRATGTRPKRLTPARSRVMALADDGLARAKSDLAREASVSTGVIDQLVDDGVLEPLALPAAGFEKLDPDHPAPPLNAGQADAAIPLVEAVRTGGYQALLLDGITGSGKTEVYMEAMAAALRAGGQVLVLMPEIALTGQSLERFTRRFGNAPAPWHSGITGGRRARTWRGVASGEVSVVVGARSALFLPFARLRLIIVDEEHENAYKQEEGGRYHARDMAVMRARLLGIPVILASATPSLESRVNADQGRYRRIALEQRFGGYALPQVESIDMRVAGPQRGRWIAPKLEALIRATHADDGQSLLFLNRRGYAPLTLCKACGERLKCPNCTAWMVDHRFRSRLICHHCGHSMPRPGQCFKCNAEDSFVPCGPGVERLAEECANLFPEQRLLVLSSDMAGGMERLKQEIEAVARGEVDIIIGTQLVAKGHNFPSLALVGVIDADLALASGDPRAGERTFQLIQQVVGRAGRARHGSRAVLQTHMPDHPVIDAILRSDREAFYASEIELRREASLPPFGRMVALIVSANNAPDAHAYARLLAARAPHDGAVAVLGPAEAPIHMLRGRYRVRLLAKSARDVPLSPWVRHWLSQVEAPRGSVKLEIDVDPLSFL